MPPKHGLREKRTAAIARAEGSTVSGAAHAAGVHRSTVWRWESGGDADYCNVLRHCKRALLQDAADLAALAGREMLRRLVDEPTAVSSSELNRIWGTAADKLLAQPEPTEALEPEVLDREGLVDRLAELLDDGMLDEIRERRN